MIEKILSIVLGSLFASMNLENKSGLLSSKQRPKGFVVTFLCLYCKLSRTWMPSPCTKQFIIEDTRYEEPSLISSKIRVFRLDSSSFSFWQFPIIIVIRRGIKWR